MDGGSAGNIVADRCRAEFEFRSIASVDSTVVRARIQAYCDELQETVRHENTQARVELRTLAMVPGRLRRGEPRRTARSSPRGRFPSSKVTYGTEAGLFQAAGTETIMCGPGDIHQAPTANEFVELDQIRACKTTLGQPRASPEHAITGHGS